MTTDQMPEAPEVARLRLPIRVQGLERLVNALEHIYGKGLTLGQAEADGAKWMTLHAEVTP